MLNVNETVTSIKPCYKIRYLSLKIWRYAESPYLCNVFFIVLDLRLTKVGARRCSFFYVYTSGYSVNVPLSKKSREKLCFT